ncbi:MAG: hypothetical protein IPJ76_02360 [Flavobacteriales bacterium]|nr:MAG: hypothetical protein IPJ76_02360 [Flavobacteriales bacterium]
MKARSWCTVLLLGVLAHAVGQGARDQVFKIGGVYFADCKQLVGSEGAVLLNVGDWRGAATDVDMDVRGERGQRMAVVRNGQVVFGDTARYRVQRDDITFVLWDAQTGRVICLLRHWKPDSPRFKRQVNVSLDVFTSDGRVFHCDPEHSDLPAMEMNRTNTFIGKEVGLELE